MKNFLLINPRYAIRHPPLGLGYLASYLNAYYPQRYQFRVVDYAFQDDRDLDVALTSFRPHIVGLTATTNTFLEARRLAQFIKERLNVPIIIGGVHITAIPEDLLDSPFDIAVLGEGEETLLELAQYFDQTGKLPNENIQGVAFQVNGRLVKTPERPLIADLDTIPPPDYSLLAMREFYTRPKALAHGFYAKGASMMPSRGCPYGNCSFCGSNLMWHRRVRFFSPRRVFEEISHLIKTYDLNSIIFLDDNFTTKRDFLKELSELIGNSDFAGHFKFDCESIAEFLDDEKAHLLKKMGCERIEFGFESGNQRVLSALKNTRAKLSQSVEAIQICHRHDLKVLGNFIFGWADETPAEISETYEFIQKNPIDYVAWHTLAPYPGTKAWRLLEERCHAGRGDFRRQDYYSLETCNSPLLLNPSLDPRQAMALYQSMRQQAYLTNTNIIHDLGLTEPEKQELWEAFRRDMENLQISNPKIVQTQPNEKPQTSPRPSPPSLASQCRALEQELPVPNREIMAEFGLLEGHPWAHHANSEVTTYYACLYGLVQSFKPKRILEIGTGFGLSAAALLKACDPLEILVTMDLGIFAESYKFPENNIAYARCKLHEWCTRQNIPTDRVRFFQANTQPSGQTDNDHLPCTAPHWRGIQELQDLLIPESFDLLFVDGKHTEDGLYQDMKTFWEFLRPGGLLVCDDLHDESYRDLFPWAGETVASFERFTAEFAGDIQEHFVWDFPRVLPATHAGLRPFGLIRKKEQPEMPKESQAIRTQAPDLSPVVAALAQAQRRLYLRDQTPASLATLIKLAEEFQPTRIVELGTYMGLSLRAWLAAPTSARLTAIDLSFAPLRESLALAPADLSRVTLLEQDILQTDFSRLWGNGDRVLLYVDAHDQPQAPLMTHILNNALPALPPGSLVVVDDVWYSPTPLDSSTVKDFFRSKVLPEIDPLQCFAGHYASYWQGGAFLGFAEVIPLLTWTNQLRLNLTVHPEAKLVSFAWPSDSLPIGEPATSGAWETATGTIFHHPVENFALTAAHRLTLDREALTAISLFLEGGELFAQGRIREALKLFTEAGDLSAALAGVWYAQAVCLARLGDLETAARCLKRELAGFFPHQEARRLRHDIQRWLSGPEQASEPRDLPQENPRLTIFAIPKAFEGHTGVIQENALKSWTRLEPRPEIILFGNDPGTAEVAGDLHLRHVPEVAVTDHGTPLVSDLFRRAEALASTDTLAYVNADIILTQDFLDAVSQVQERFPQFLMVGQRWDLDFTEPVDFADPDWQEALKGRVSREGVLHAVSALDYFVFSQGLWPEIPDLALGRTAWDNWLVAQPLEAEIPVVDATPAVLAVHQNHDYQHVQGGADAVWKGKEARHNQEIAWESPLLCYSSHATWELTPQGLKARFRQAQAMAQAWEGLALITKEDFRAALATFDEIFKLLPEGIPGLHYVRGLALAGLGQREEAVQALKAELAPHPSHHPARKFLASLGNGRQTRQAAPAQVKIEGPLPVISVVIPTHNRAQYLAEAVASALSQEFQDLEVVVVDDGGTDNTPEVLAQVNDPRLRYLRKPKSNAPDTRNHCINAARGEWLLWLDSDDMLLPGWLARLGSLLEAGAEADVYYGNLEVVDAQGRRLNIIRYEDFAGKNELLLARMIHGNPLPLPGSLVRRELLKEVGGFDVEFTRAHDYELWTRLAPVARFRHVPFLSVKWRWHDANMSSGSVNRDLSFDAKVVKRLLTRHSLKELFFDLPWNDWARAHAQAAQQLGEIFSRYGDLEAAREWLTESRELLPTATSGAEHAPSL